MRRRRDLVLILIGILLQNEILFQFFKKKCCNCSTNLVEIKIKNTLDSKNNFAN